MQHSCKPILITSPVKRSGSTLIQRLLCSSRNCLIYGDDCAMELNAMVNLFHLKSNQLSMREKRNQDVIEAVLAGNTNQWLAHLMPPIPAYIDNLKSSYFLFMKYLQEFALQHGRSIWGIKLAGWPGHQLELVRKYFPESKVIYIERDLESCMKSAKAQSMMNTSEEAHFFCHTWQSNTSFYSKWKNENWFHSIDYDELIKNSNKVIQELSNFTNAIGIQTSVIDKKINAPIQNKMDLDRQYVNPLKLNKIENELVQAFV